MPNGAANGDNSGKNRQVVITERSPLLPIKQEETSGLDGSNGASFNGAVFNLSTTIIGAGMMALPATVNELGMVLGVSAIVFMAFLTEASIELMVRYSQAAKTVSYACLMRDTFGKCGKRLFQICVSTNNAGLLVVYMIIIGDVLSGMTSDEIHHTGVLEGWFEARWWNTRFFVLLFTTVTIFAPLVSLKKIGSLRYTSALSFALAVIFLLITVGITLYKLIDGSILVPRLFPNVTSLASFFDLFTVVPVLVTAYVAHYNVHSIDNELDDDIHINEVVRFSLVLCSVVYLMMGLFGFLLFGDETLDDVLANFSMDLRIPYGSLISDIVRVSYAAHLILVFPVIFYPLRLNLDGLLFPSSRPLATDNLRFALLSIGIMAVVFSGANFIPSIWDAFQFTGATAAVCIGFIFPSAITLRDRYGIATRRDKLLSVFMIVLAIFANLVAIYSNARELFNMNP